MMVEFEQIKEIVEKHRFEKLEDNGEYVEGIDCITSVDLMLSEIDKLFVNVGEGVA